MALKPKKEAVSKEEVVCKCNCSENLETLVQIVDSLVTRVEALEAKKPRNIASIHKVEDFNGDVATPVEEYSQGMKMDFEDKLISMRNAIAILPPNLMEDGKHTASNIGAICGFIVTDEMYDRLYEDAA